MLYINKTTGFVTEDHEVGRHSPFESAHDFLSIVQAQIAADMANCWALKAGRPERYIPVDQGPCVLPRFDVIEAPRVGAKVSRAFNGDYYPAGEIVKVSGSLRRVETSDGTVFYRRRETASWRSKRTWFMVGGHHSEKNPSF